MIYDLSVFNQRKEEVIDWLTTEYAGIVAGKITPSLLDKVVVDTYGSKVELSHCATITIEDAKTILVAPYDKELIPQIESDLRNQLDSFTISVNDAGIRVIASELTGERREFLQNTAKERMEKAKQSIRMSREKIINEIKGSSELSEDDTFESKKQLQDSVDEINKEIDTVYKNKLEDIKS